MLCNVCLQNDQQSGVWWSACGRAELIGLFPKSDVTAEVGCASIGLQTARYNLHESKLNKKPSCR